MERKDKIFKFVVSSLLIVFGTLLLLDQLNVPFIDEFFTPWYSIVLLFIIGCMLAYAIIRKSPIVYCLTMLMAGVYLVISLHYKVDNVSLGKIIAIVPLFLGLGLVMADAICKWSIKAMRLGYVTTIASAIVLISTILDIWKVVIPIVVVLIGIAYLLFVIIDCKKSNETKSRDHYVTYESDDDQEDKE